MACTIFFINYIEKREDLSFIAVLRRITIAVSPPETKQKLLHDVNKITHKSSLFFGGGGGYHGYQCIKGSQAMICTKKKWHGILCYSKILKSINQLT